MSQYKIKLLVLGDISTNCYILYKEDAKSAIIFDPADEAWRIEDAIGQLGVKPEAILLTHGHYDHIMAAKELKERYGIKIYAHEQEAGLCENSMMNLSAISGYGCSLQIDEPIRDGEALSLAGFSLKVLHTPGHTQGSVCYYLEEERLLFSGDTLFAGSVGRSDFPTGSMAALMHSVRDKLALLPEDVLVFPGHGEQSEIGYEKQHNPFM